MAAARGVVVGIRRPICVVGVDEGRQRGHLFQHAPGHSAAAACRSMRVGVWVFEIVQLKYLKIENFTSS